MLNRTSRHPYVRLLASALVLCLLPTVPASAGDDSSSLSGVVRSEDGRSTLAGARVFAGDPETGEVYPSGWTGEDGTFEIRGLPPASYRLAVESNAGLHLIDLPVPLGKGMTRTVGISVNAAPAGDDAGGGGETEGGETEGGGESGKTNTSRRPNLWNNPLTAALIVIGLAVVFGLVIANATDDDDGFVEESATEFLQ
jgi:hypothetical protein